MKLNNLVKRSEEDFELFGVPEILERLEVPRRESEGDFERFGGRRSLGRFETKETSKGEKGGLHRLSHPEHLSERARIEALRRSAALTKNA